MNETGERFQQHAAVACINMQILVEVGICGALTGQRGFRVLCHIPREQNGIRNIHTPVDIDVARTLARTVGSNRSGAERCHDQCKQGCTQHDRLSHQSFHIHTPFRLPCGCTAQVRSCFLLEI